MSLDQTMDRVLARRGEVEARLSEAGGMAPDELAALSRELSELRPVCEQIELVQSLEADRDTAAQMIEESDGDAEIMEMARGEIEEIDARLPDEMKALQLLLLPRDRDDSRNAILEVRAGTGGDEAALFASDLFGMYQRFAARHGWCFEVMEISGAPRGGQESFKEVFKSSKVTIHGVCQVIMSPQGAVGCPQRAPKELLECQNEA